MEDLTYNIVYKGRILDGHDFDGVRSQLVEKFSLSREKAEQLLNGKRVIIKKNLDMAAAKKIGLALKKAGLDVVMTQFSIPAFGMPSPGESEAEGAPMPQPEAPVSNVSEPQEHKTRRKKPLKVTLPFEFHGTGGEYFKIWIVNTILSIITLGIYSAWAKVRRKQYFYGSTRLQKSSFEYLADPVNILKGRAIVFIFFLFYSVIAEFFPLIGGLLGLSFVLILPWLVVRSLAFNARNSAYRNIHFGFDGSVMEAFKAFVLWPFLAVFTLGILFPYVLFRQKKFIVENSSYGRTNFTFNAGPKDYYNLMLKGLVPIVIGLALVGVTFFLHPFVSGLIGMVLYFYLFAYFSVKYTNLIFNSIELSAHHFKADLDTWEYLVLIFTNTLGMVFTLGIFYPWAHVRTLSYKLDHLKLTVQGDLDNFIAQKQKKVSALGDEASDFFDFDIGL